MFDFPGFVKDELELREMSQSQLAAKAGVSESSLCSWLMGCPAKISSMEKVLNALDCELRICEKGY